MNDHKGFFAMMARMKYIERWALMRNSVSENICEHSLEVAMLAHGLGISPAQYAVWRKRRRGACGGVGAFPRCAGDHYRRYADSG